jgi:Polysaccharide lyase family 4, domain II
MTRIPSLRAEPCPRQSFTAVSWKPVLCGTWLLIGLLVGGLWAQDATVRGAVQVLHHSEREMGSGDVVVWLTPISGGAAGPGPTAHLLQKNKKFIPHVLAVTQGTEIEFPNQDPFFHNVSSIHQGKTIDLGLYESGAARKIRFSQPGVSYIFCNIHPQMSAVVVVLQTRLFTVTDTDGSFQINRVPPGRYKLSVWYELAPQAELAGLDQEIEVSAGTVEVPKITLHSSDTPPQHPNKDGQPYY